MSDTSYTSNLRGGFFDSENQDRLYSADDMTQPYRRLVSDGVYAQQNGSPSTDFQVFESTGMQLTVKAGQAMLGGKWLSLAADLQITAEENNGILPRLDSVIARMDTRQSVRAASIVYRQGVQASEQDLVPPSLDNTPDVYELRLANVRVNANATEVTQNLIYDTRGGAECGWVTGLIQQVDTSTLFEQWVYAYNQYFAESTTQFEEFTEAQWQAWEDFLDQVTTTLSVTPNVMRLEAYTETTAGESEFYPARLITSFDDTRDILMVYVNGMLLNPSMYSTSGTGIDYKVTLTNAVPVGTVVLFEVFKSLITSDLSSVQSLIQDLDTKISPYISDTGWEDITWTNPAVHPYNTDNKTQIRMIGNQVYIRGALIGAPSRGATLTTLPVEYWPAQDIYITSGVSNGTDFYFTLVFWIKTNGEFVLKAGPTQMGTGANLIPINTSYLVD